MSIVLHSETKAFGRVRRVATDDPSTTSREMEQVGLTQQLEQLIAPSENGYEDIVRSGRAFSIGTTAAVASVIAKPTTACMFAIHNDEPEGGRSYIIDYVSALNIVSTALVSSQSILIGNVGQIRVAAPTDSGLIPLKRNGLGSVSNAVVRRQDTKVLSHLAATALNASMGIAHCWIPISAPANQWGATNTPGYGIWAPINGRIIIPPGRMFAVHVLSNVTTQTFIVRIGWHERQLVLG